MPPSNYSGYLPARRLGPAGKALPSSSASTSNVGRVLRAKKLRLASFSVGYVRSWYAPSLRPRQACFSRRRTSQTSPAEALMPPRSRTIGVVAALAVVTACAPESVTEQGKDVNRLYDFFSVAAAVIFTITAGLIARSIARYRGRAGDDLPEQWHSNVPLEIFWFAVPSVIVVVLFLVSMSSLNVVEEKSESPQVSVTVEGFQWGWRFSYEGGGVVISGTAQDPPEIMVPVNESVSFEVTSADVIHAFYIPKFMFK